VSDYRAILLDLYDTLAWTEWPALRGLIEERTGLSTPALLDAFDLTRGARSVGAYGSAEGDLRVVLEAAGSEPTPELIEELARLVDRVLDDGVHLWEDSLPVLRELRARGIRTAVVSNCDHSTRRVVQRLGLSREADAVVLSFEAGVAKPDAGIYLAALEAVGTRPEETLFVDDQARYCDGAVELGMDALLILREGDEPWEGVSEPGGHRVIGLEPARAGPASRQAYPRAFALVARAPAQPICCLTCWSRARAPVGGWVEKGCEISSRRRRAAGSR
jgi:putative hydrolase of the HAD superfamily